MKRFVTLFAAALLTVGVLSCKGTPKSPPKPTVSPLVPEPKTETRPVRPARVRPTVGPARDDAAKAGSVEVLGAVVAVVNSEIITKEEILSDLSDEFVKLEADRSYSEHGRRVRRTELIRDRIRFHVERQLALQEADRRLSEEQQEMIEMNVDHYVKGLIRSIGSAAQLEKELARKGQTIKTKRTEEIENRMLAQLWQTEIGKHTFVRPREMRAYYETHTADYHRKRAVRIRQIYLSFAGSADKAQARQKGIDILERLGKGEDFAHLATKYSQGPHAAEGGLWEEFIESGSGELRPEVERVVFRLSVKQISPLIESEIGCHIIKAEDVRPERQVPFAEVQEEIAKTLRAEKREAKKRQFIEKLWKNSYVEVRWK